MADEYTPKVSAVRGDYAGCGLSRDRRLADFDRFLAAHEAEVRERIARAIEVLAYSATGAKAAIASGECSVESVETWDEAINQAARIARGAAR